MVDEMVTVVVCLLCMYGCCYCMNAVNVWLLTVGLMEAGWNGWNEYFVAVVNFSCIENC